MKKSIIPIIALSWFLISACNSSESKSAHEGHTTTTTEVPAAATEHASAKASEARAITAVFKDLNPSVAASIKEIVGQYLKVKNALASDNGKDAAAAGKAMADALGKMDKSLLTADQKKPYDEQEEMLKEHASHIADNPDKIAHQRGHFASMSEGVYALVKQFGGGQVLYHDHCPMYNDNKGGMWLSETREVKNPYFGAQMLTCGTVEEIIQ